MEKAAVTWFEQRRDAGAGIPISGPSLRVKAKWFAARFGVQDFYASDGWLYRFKTRYDVTGKTVSGESNSVDYTVQQNLGHVLSLGF